MPGGGRAACAARAARARPRRFLVPWLAAAAAAWLLRQVLGAGWAPALLAGAPARVRAPLPRSPAVVRWSAGQESDGARQEGNPLEELKAGQMLEGRVASITNLGISVDVGFAKYGRVLAPREVIEKLTMNQTVSATVESVNLERGVFKVSLAEMPKLKSIKDLREGDMVDGIVAMRTDTGILIDIGYEVLAYLRLRKLKEAFKLNIREELKGLKVVQVDVDNAKVSVYFAGLSDFLKKQTAKAEDPFKDLKPGQVLRGTVGNKIRSGSEVYADVGLGKNAWVDCSAYEGLLLKWGEELDLVVKSVNHNSGRAVVTVSNLEELVAGRETKRMGLQKLEVGSTVTGHIEGKDYYAVWVDVGAWKSARLRPGGARGKSRVQADEFQAGAEVQVRLDEVDVETGKVEASLLAEQEEGQPAS